ncbi:MAG: phosphoribosyl-ATP diphosphatase, partial [Beijerinckiaceae bacterium]
MTDSIQNLYRAVQNVRHGDPETSRTAKLLQGDLGKMAKKVGEEALEVGLDAVLCNRQAVIEESADLIYNLV